MKPTLRTLAAPSDHNQIFSSPCRTTRSPPNSSSSPCRTTRSLSNLCGTTQSSVAAPDHHHIPIDSNLSHQPLLLLHHLLTSSITIVALIYVYCCYPLHLLLSSTTHLLLLPTSIVVGISCYFY